MLTQLNTTLEEENKAMVEQLNKIVGQVSRTCYSCYTLLVVLTLCIFMDQNQELLLKSWEDKDLFMEEERVFS